MTPEAYDVLIKTEPLRAELLESLPGRLAELRELQAAHLERIEAIRNDADRWERLRARLADPAVKFATIRRV